MYLVISLLFVSLITKAAEHGVFMVVKGKVKIENLKSTTEAKIGSKIQVGDTVVTEADSRAKIVMSDRNVITISPNTKIKIEKYSNSNTDKNVNMNLIEGKVRNNVEQKYDNKTSKFEVRTATAVAGVRGTQFITSFNPKTKVTEVITLRGQVMFQSLAANTGTGIAANESVVVDKGEKSEVKEGAPATGPVKVPDQELREVDTETSGKKQTDINPISANNGQPPPKAPLDDLNKRNDLIKDGTASRKFDKSKVKVIVTPNSSGTQSNPNGP